MFFLIALLKLCQLFAFRARQYLHVSQQVENSKLKCCFVSRASISLKVFIRINRVKAFIRIAYFITGEFPSTRDSDLHGQTPAEDYSFPDTFLAIFQAQIITFKVHFPQIMSRIFQNSDPIKHEAPSKTLSGSFPGKTVLLTIEP